MLGVLRPVPTGTTLSSSGRSRQQQHLLQLLHVERLVQVQAGVLVLSGGGVGEPLQEPLQAKRPRLWF